MSIALVECEINSSIGEFMYDIWVDLGCDKDMNWAQRTVAERHYLRSPVDPRARPMTYVVRLGERRVGLVMAGIPHATKNRTWWGYPGLPTQWQVVDLCRIWLDPFIQRGGECAQLGIVPGFVDRRGEFRPTVATWAIHQVLSRIQRDRVALWPPVYPSQPYHILLAISYSDPRFHRGVIYREAGATPMYVGEDGRPLAGSSGKYGWCWRLPKPAWSWEELTGIRSRTMRLF